MKPLWITKAQYLSNYTISLSFNDGLQKIVDLENHLNGEIFAPLKNIENFKRFILNDWTIEWENGADISPEFLYSL